ncbi:MAG TPA: ATP-dependent sacrificial sulfur transferase LarE [Thermoanaerobaculia bacterium]|nr:ATP-dependent sacrificial sulfur transferase LarE [Thermoanaerobaculia bacterium]
MTLTAPGLETVSREETMEALARLESSVGSHERLLIAFSGGVDSAVLLAVAHRALGERAAAITADSPSMARAELDGAIRFAARLGVRHRIVTTGEMERPEYVRNEPDRCFWCKQTLFEVSARLAEEAGGATVAYGYTRDDVGDYRPGHEAARTFRVATPLWDANLGKREIRAIALALGLDVWDKPAAPCLSSRIPYGSEVTVEKLRAIEAMESLLHESGFRVCRARYDGSEMRIEVESADLARAAEPAIQRLMNEKARELGVERLALDPEGFVSGKLNRRVRREG